MLSKDYNGAICEVKGTNNTLIATGSIRLIRGSEDTLEVTDAAGHLPLLSLDTKVILVVHHPHLGLQVLEGKVYISGNMILRVKDVKAQAAHDPRRFFRQGIDHSAFLLLDRGMKDAHGAPLPSKLAVRVKDISLCGLLFESERAFRVGDEMRVNMTLLHNELEIFKVVVRREIHRDNGLLAYGCEIVELPSRLEQRLTAFVLEQQQQQIRKSRM